jgi:cysteinyl-tRNA synthetase
MVRKMPLKLYNTKTRTIGEFQPRTPPAVSLYTCGPTVYNYAHIGNLRTYVFEDVLVRALRHVGGFDVTRVMNVTDVGHLVSDADEGEDKMALAMRREGKTAHDIAEFYWDAFKGDMARLNLLPPNVWCKATEHIDVQKAQVEALAEKGFTYVIEDGIYFDTSKFPDYGKFAHLDLDGLRAGHRVEMTEGKRNPTDFAVWKFSPKDRRRLMEWDNPCGIPGKGFPGWHIECSAMAVKYLGEHLDIHCGGVDHVNVHHTNEIAQAECALGHEWCDWWLHGEFLTMGEAGKMAKSAGEFLTLDLLVEKGYDPLAYRYFLLGAHYRQQLAFSWEALDTAANAYSNLKQVVPELRKKYQYSKIRNPDYNQCSWEFLDEFNAAVCDDLNMPRALAAMWKCIRSGDTNYHKVYPTLKIMDEVLGLGIKNMQEKELDRDLLLTIQDLQGDLENYDKTPEELINLLIQKRSEARQAKDFARSDEIRDQLAAAGVELLDSADGTTWRRK